MLRGRELSDEKFQLDSLDGLRGLAVLIVFLSHTSNAGMPLFSFANFSGIGKSGVFLFFVLSSFLLTLPFIKLGERAMCKKFMFNYFMRRFFRIYPLYFVYLLLGLFTTLLMWKVDGKPVIVPFPLSIGDFFEHIFLIQGKGLAWSILVEFRYYFILPILALTYSVVLKNKLVPSIILTLGLIFLSQLVWPQSESTVNDPRLGPYLPIFFMGSLLAVIFSKWQDNRMSENQKNVIIVEVFGMVALVGIIFLIPSVASYLVGKPVSANYNHQQFILFGILWSIVIFSCVAGFGVLKRLFETAFLRYLGFISFSVYLLHIVVLLLIRKFGTFLPLQGWLTLLLTIAISHITWMLIEKPTSKFKFVKASRKAKY